MIDTKLSCTCPSGDGSLRWPCPKHPPETASPAAAVPDGALPPLPTSQIYVRVWESTKEPGESLQLASQPYFTAEQMQAYARAAVEADRAQRQATLSAELIAAADATVERWHSKDWKQPHTAEFINRLAAAVGAAKAADRAQQGEPVDEEVMREAVSDFRKAAYEFGKHHEPDDHARMMEAQLRIFATYRAATKAAAPADAPTEHSRFGSPAMQALILANLAAPAPDTGIPTAEQSIDDQLTQAPSPVKQDDKDPLYDKAVMVVRAKNHASISLVQRTFMIGYNRASRLMERMEAEGVISSPNEDGARFVLSAPAHPGEGEKPC